MARKKIGQVPRFEDEDAERACWAQHDSTEVLDWSKARPAVFSNLKPTQKTISIRLPETMLAHLKVLANKRGIPYQSLLKSLLSERLQEELAKAS